MVPCIFGKSILHSMWCVLNDVTPLHWCTLASASVGLSVGQLQLYFQCYNEGVELYKWVVVVFVFKLKLMLFEVDPWLGALGIHCHRWKNVWLLNLYNCIYGLKSLHRVVDVWSIVKVCMQCLQWLLPLRRVGVAPLFSRFLRLYLCVSVAMLSFVCKFVIYYLQASLY